MVICLKRIYNFLCSLFILHQFLWVLSILHGTFYAFSRTNLLTRCRSASSCFLLFLVSENLYRKYSGNGTGQKPNFLFYRREDGARRGVEDEQLGLARTEGWCAHLEHSLASPLRLFDPLCF